MNRWKVIGTAGPVLVLGVVIVAVIIFDLTTDSGAATQRLGLATPIPTHTPGPSPTPGPTLTPSPQPTAVPGAEQRDAQRRLELKALGQALAEYREQHGLYPETGGNIQSLCVYGELDAGCELEEFLERPLPEDPLGDPLNNGYWYTSDGSSFALIAQQEVSIPSPEHACPATPSDRAFAAFYCLTAP